MKKEIKINYDNLARAIAYTITREQDMFYDDGRFTIEEMRANTHTKRVLLKLIGWNDNDAIRAFNSVNSARHGGDGIDYRDAQANAIREEIKFRLNK